VLGRRLGEILDTVWFYCFYWVYWFQLFQPSAGCAVAKECKG
jgi:hypothetical protein